MKLQKQFNKEYSLAVDYFKKNNHDKSIEICKKIIGNGVKSGDVHYLLSLSLGQLKKYSDALIEINKAVEINNKNLSYYLFRGNLHREVKDYENALKNFQIVLEMNSTNSDALHWIAATMYQMGEKKSALNVLNSISPKEEVIKNSLLKAKCLEDLHFFHEALDVYDKLIENDSNNVQTLLAKSDLHRRMFQYENALELVQKAMLLEKDNINCYMLLSAIFKDTQDIGKSLQILDAGLKIMPNSEQANFNKSIILLQAGNLKEGWQFYEWRWRLKEWTSLPLNSTKPLWQGERNTVLFLWPEQGIGDEVMFASIFEDVKKDVKKLIVKIDERLIDIYQRSFTDIEFISSREQFKDENFDFHLPIGSLPKFYRNNLSDFENKDGKYLKTNDIIDENIKFQFNQFKSKRKIGVSWKSKNPLSGLKRSAELLDIIKYINDPNAVFVNLQYGDVKSEIMNVREKGIEIIDIIEIDNMKNIDGLLSIINQCDDVVSIDNSTVHFSGALGKKTEVLMHSSADFRWELQGNTTKWYKSLNLKRNIIL